MTDQREFLASLPRKRIAVGVVFQNARGEVLLVEPTYRDRWQLPGGVVEASESPATAAVREVAEELGLDLAVGRPLVIRWLSPTNIDPHGAMTLDYDGGRLSDDVIDQIRVPPDELRGHRFVPPHQIAQWTTEGTKAPIGAALGALNDGGVAQLEGNDLRLCPEH